MKGFCVSRERRVKSDKCCDFIQRRSEVWKWDEKKKKKCGGVELISAAPGFISLWLALTHPVNLSCIVGNVGTQEDE